jgi:hypothetical protein
MESRRGVTDFRLIEDEKTVMPSLLRFLFVLGLLAAGGFVAMAALVAFVEPQPREIVQPLPPAALNK